MCLESAVSNGRREQSRSSHCLIRDQIMTLPHGKRILRSDVSGTEWEFLIHSLETIAFRRLLCSNVNKPFFAHLYPIWQQYVEHWYNEQNRLFTDNMVWLFFCYGRHIYSKHFTLSPLWICVQPYYIYIYSFCWYFTQPDFQLWQGQHWKLCGNEIWTKLSDH